PPAAPAVGSGDLTVAPNTTISTPGFGVGILSARRDQDTIGANFVLNGATYAPNPLYDLADQGQDQREIWRQRYPTTLLWWEPYRLLYEDDDLVKPTVTITTPAPG